jgi:23S rRNA pseudouridine955/2504/2580 synthase
LQTPIKTIPLSAVTFHEVDAEYAGQRLDNFLIRLLKGVPKSRIYRLLRKGEVRVNKGRVKADTRLATGDVIRVAPIRVSDNSLRVCQAVKCGRVLTKVLSLKMMV